MLFALPTLVGLILLGRLDALVTLPFEFRPLAASFGDRGNAAFCLIAAIGGMIAGAGLLALRHRLGGRPFSLGTIDALLPRDRAELLHAALLSIGAGVAEELFFRLLAPLLIGAVTGNALLGFGLATVLFAAAHRYQGWVGMSATLVLGGLFACFYLATGDLWAAMLLHIALNLVALVLRPALTGAWRRV